MTTIFFEKSDIIMTTKKGLAVAKLTSLFAL